MLFMVKMWSLVIGGAIVGSLGVFYLLCIALTPIGLAVVGTRWAMRRIRKKRNYVCYCKYREATVDLKDMILMIVCEVVIGVIAIGVILAVM